ncbi:MAG: MFS transporter [Actinomycetales bacterium]
MRRELILVASRKRGHLNRLRIGLVVKEHVEVMVFDTPEQDCGCQFLGARHIQSLLRGRPRHLVGLTISQTTDNMVRRRSVRMALAAGLGFAPSLIGYRHVVGEAGAAARRAGALAVLCAASFLAVVDTTIVTIALPTIRTQLGFSITGVQWVLNAYTLVFAGMLLLFGRLADRVGRRRAFMAGLAVFGVGSVLAAAAPTSAVLVTGRVGQGLGAAAFVPSSLSLLTVMFAEADERSRALAAYGSMAGLGFVVGMVGGGVITQTLGWPWVFWINLPLVAAMLLWSPHVLSESRGSRGSRLDLSGAVTVTVGVAGVVYALAAVPRYGWVAPQMWAATVVGGAGLTGFVLIERRHPAPLVPPTVVAHSRVLVPNIAIVLQSMVGIAWLYLLTLYFQTVQGRDPLNTGLLFAPMTIASILGATVAGRMLPHTGFRTAALIGVGSTAAGVAVMAAAADWQSGTTVMIVAMAFGEAGFMVASVALTTAAATSLDDSHVGLAAGIYNTATQLGAALGLAVVASVVAAAAGDLHVGGGAIRYGFLACLAFCLMAIVLVATQLTPRRT